MFNVSNPSDVCDDDLGEAIGGLFGGEHRSLSTEYSGEYGGELGENEPHLGSEPVLPVALEGELVELGCEVIDEVFMFVGGCRLSGGLGDGQVFG